MPQFKYLHAVGDGSFYLDHRLVPEVSAMLCAMASRAPVGGVQARYVQVVEAVGESLLEEWGWPVLADVKADDTPYDRDTVYSESYTRYELMVREAEGRLCVYPLHPKVEKFFGDFVGKYGHSSIMELTGQPAVYTEGISWLTAWLLFDSPLCAGQEFSTRAVQHKDWPMARECDYAHVHCPDGVYEGEPIHIEDGGISLHAEPGDVGFTYIAGNPILAQLHEDWFEIFEAEVAWWKEHLASEENRKALGIGDKEPFRPALDRARWALPGTIATGCAHTTSLRERARVLKDGANLAAKSGASAAQAVWAEITDTYRQALPGLAGMGLREAVYTPETNIPGHLVSLLSDAPDGPDVELEESFTDGLSDVAPFRRKSDKAYLDPAANTVYRFGVTFRCSLAVARDWHRHRTLYPWHLQVVREPREVDGVQSWSIIGIDHHYAPMSDLAKAKVLDLLVRSTMLFDKLMAEGNVAQAALCLPLGTRVRMRGNGGLRDVLYMLELRKNAHGANFEYKEQATTALDILADRMRDYFVMDEIVVDRYGIVP